MRLSVKIFMITLAILLASCASSPATVEISDSTPTSTATVKKTRIPTLTPSLMPSKTPTRTPSPSYTPTPSPTIIGGGSGLILLENCLTSDNCTQSLLSLADLRITDSMLPAIKKEVVDTEAYKNRLVLFNPLSGETKPLLECSDEFAICSQRVLLGTLENEWVYIAQEYQQQLYDGNVITDIFRLNTISLQITLLDHFEGSINAFLPFPDTTKGLVSFYGYPRRGELIIYDLETLERQTIIEKKGQIYRVGTTPDSGVFWYRIADFCETELVSEDGFRVTQLKNSDGIADWVNFDTFLLFTSVNNPPVCSHNGINLANRTGITVNWITTAPSNWAMKSPSGGKIFYTSNCNSNGCTQVILTNPDDGTSSLIMENSQRFTETPSTTLSPDGSKLIISWGNKILMINADGTDPQVLLETEKMWQIINWMDVET